MININVYGTSIELKDTDNISNTIWLYISDWLEVEKNLPEAIAEARKNRQQDIKHEIKELYEKLNELKKELESCESIPS